MKKKIRIKGLPKAQFAGQPSMVLTPEQQDIWRANQNMFGTPPQQTISVPDYMGSTNTTPSITQGMTPFSVVPPLMTKSFNSANVFGTGAMTMPKQAPSVTPLLNDQDQFNEPFGPLTSSDYYKNVAEQNTAAPAGTIFTEDAAFAPGMGPISNTPSISSSGMPQGVGFLPFIGSEIFASLGNKLEESQRNRGFRNKFLADAMYNPLPSDYSGTRGDYVTNQGLGINFRPDEAVYGQFGKIAQYGGQMKRKIRITGLPQQQYGGTQNKASVDEMYPYNSNVRRAKYSNMLEGESDPSVRQYIEEVPREIANIEAEAGETIIQPNDNGLVNMYKIGGKRHSEGGTPLQADENDFIFSDTKAMKIKDPAVLESFGFKYKKGGYTPAKISKKFNLNDPNIQRTLNDPNADMIERNTAKMMYDNYLSQLGKLALVQEGHKGFPQGAPDISIPYMQKIGMDPSMFMPDVMTPQDASFQMGKAQFGQQGTKIRPWEGGATQAGTYTPTGQLNKFSTRKQKLGEYLSTWEDVIPNIKSMSEGEAQDAIYSWALKNDPEAISNMWSTYGLTKKGLSDPKLRAMTLDSKGMFSPETLKNQQNLEALKSGYVDELFGARQLERRKQPPAPIPPDTPPAFIPPTTPPPPAPGPKPNVIPEPTPTPAEPGKYYIQDLMNTGLAMGNRLGVRKYSPYDAPVPEAALMDPTFYDPSRELAATGEMANMITQNLGQFAGPQALSSRASQIQGNAAKSVADTLGRYNNLNVGVANQFEQINKGIINDFNLKNAQAKSNFYDKTVIANQQYDNAKRAANARLMQQATNAITNKAMTQVLNSMYPEYAIDPTVGGEMMYVPSQRSVTGQSIPGSQVGTSDVSQNINQLRKQFENDPDFKNLTPKEKLDVLAKFMPRESSMTRRYDPRDVFFANMLRSNRR